MSAKPERRSLQEQLGSSLNASVLKTGRPDVETPLTQVAALGAAGLHVAFGADRAGARGDIVPVFALADRTPDPRDVVDAELASVLKHVREAGQEHRLPQAIRLFAQHVANRSRFAELPDRDRLIYPFAARALHEWLSSRCPRCGGTGLLEVSPTGQLIRGQGRMQRNQRTRSCPVPKEAPDGKLWGCGGTGRARPSPPARMKALDINRERYDNERWAAHFNAGLAWLEQLSRRIHRPLTMQLDRRIKHG